MVLVKGQLTAEEAPVQEIDQIPSLLGGVNLGSAFGGTSLNLHKK